MKLDNVSKSFAGRRVLNNLTYEFGKGITAITGPSGVGKSTRPPLGRLTAHTITLAPSSASINAGDKRPYVPVCCRMVACICASASSSGRGSPSVVYTMSLGAIMPMRR